MAKSQEYSKEEIKPEGRPLSEPLPRAILMDLDDTILAFSEGMAPCWRQICERFAPRLAGPTAEELFAAIQDSRTRFWSDAERARRGRLDINQARREIIAAALRQLNVDAPALVEEIAEVYGREREKTIHPLPGAIEALRALRDRGVRLGLITNGPAVMQRSKVERFGLAPLFEAIVIEGEFGAGKPDPRVYRHALERLEVAPAEAWMVGDHLEIDVAAAQSLGMVGVWMDHAGQGLPEDSPIRPDGIIRSLAELIEWGNASASF